MTSRKKIKRFYFNGGNVVPSTGMWQGEVFAISDCLVSHVIHYGIGQQSHGAMMIILWNM